MKDSSYTLADLLGQLDWMRALARELAIDPDRAEDLAHDTFVLAMERPPATYGRLRSWIATVMRNLSREQLRSRKNREALELASVIDEEKPTAAELAEQVHTQQLISKLLLELEEPYRSTLLMRYYGEHPPRVIAANQGVPLATVKSRLNRGLARLRAQLDRTYADRRGWLAALAPWMRGSGQVSAVIAGGIPMTAKIAAVAALLAAGTWMVVRGGRSETVPRVDRSVIAMANVDDRPAIGDGDPRVRGRVAVPTMPTAIPTGTADLWSLAIDRQPGSLRGVVLDGDDGSSVRGASVRMRPCNGGMPAGFKLAEDRDSKEVVAHTDQGGAFSFENLAEGPYEIEVEDARGRFLRDYASVTRKGAYLLLWLGRKSRSGPVRSLSVFVRESNGAGIGGARVTLHGSGRKPALAKPDGWTVKTDKRGWAEFPAAELRRGVLIARDPAGRVGLVGLSSTRGVEAKLRGFHDGHSGVHLGIEMLLAQPGAIEGKVKGGAGATVYAWARSQHWTERPGTRVPFKAVCDGEGRFQIGGLPPGMFELTVSAKPGLRLMEGQRVYPGSRGFSIDPSTRSHIYDPVMVEVLAGEKSPANLELVLGPILEGHVLQAADGSPVAGARVTAALPRGLKDGPKRRHPPAVEFGRLDGSSDLHERYGTTSAETRTDAQGRYEFPSLLPSPAWRIEVFHPGLSYECRQDVKLVDGEKTVLEHRLKPAGGIQGVSRSQRWLGIRRASEKAFLVTFGAMDSSLAPFAILGLPGGSYEIHAIQLTAPRGTTLLAKVDVRAGELSWVDLTENSPHHVDGRVSYRDQPVAGAVLDFFGPQVATGRDGRFRWHYPFVYRAEVGLDLLTPSILNSTALRVRYPDLCAGSSSLLQDIRVPEGAIDVRVVDEQGRSLEAFVDLSPLNKPGGMGLGYVSEEVDLSDSSGAPYTVEVLGGWSRNSNARRRTTGGGRVRFETLPPGRYELSFDTGGSVYVASIAVEVGEGKETSAFARPQRGGSLALHVERADGTPVIGEELLLNFDGRDQPLLRTTDADGLIRFNHLPPGAGRALSPSIRPPDRTEVDFQIVAGEEEQVTLTYDQEGE